MNKHLESIWTLTKIVVVCVITIDVTVAFITAINKALSPSEIEPECSVTQKDQFGFEHEIQGLVHITKRVI